MKKYLVDWTWKVKVRVNESGYKSLNLYEGVRGLAVKILNRIDRTDAYLDKMLQRRDG